jgi:hypothetical protein
VLLATENQKAWRARREYSENRWKWNKIGHFERAASGVHLAEWDEEDEA